MGESMKSIKPGEMCYDSQTGDKVFVVNISDLQAGEYVATYDYNKDPLMVSDLEDCPTDETVIEVVYPDQLERLNEALTVENVMSLIDSKKVKVYGFPEERLEDKD